jgi:hypothetical protein
VEFRTVGDEFPFFFEMDFPDEGSGEFEEEADKGKEEEEIEGGERSCETEEGAAPEIGEEAHKEVEDHGKGNDGGTCEKQGEPIVSRRDVDENLHEDWKGGDEVKKARGGVGEFIDVFGNRDAEVEVFPLV